jgi:hypothetical protein
MRRRVHRAAAALLALALSTSVVSLAACGSSGSASPSDPPGPGDAGSGIDVAVDVGTPPPPPPDSGVDAAPTPDAGGDVANDDGSAPAYPAAHPPLPQLVNSTNGPVLTAPNVYLVVYPGYPFEAGLGTFATKMTTASFWGTTTQEYGVGPLTYVKTIELTGQTPPGTIASTDVQNFVATEIQNGTFPADPQGIYTIYYPSTTTITQPNPVSSLLGTIQSCTAFGGYHDNVSVAIDGGTPTPYAYAVIATCDTQLDTLTSVTSHEWVEASTDPQLTSTGTFTLTGGPHAAYFLPDQDHLAWALMGGGEAGDLCEPEAASAYITPTDVGNAVQRTWSDKAAQASHDPCVPEIAGSFFAAAPVLTDTVTFNTLVTGSVTTKGITIPVNQNKTIEVDLFSDGPTSGAWTVTALDLMATYYGTYGFQPSMTFAWDKTQGQNGDKLNLTITVTQAATLLGGAHAFMIVSNLGSRTQVWPGIVVEQ